MAESSPPPDVDDAIVPKNVELERWLLGACLVHPEYVAVCIDLPDDLFFRDYHRKVMQGMQALRAAGRPITLATVWEHMKAQGETDVALLSSMTDGMPVPKATGLNQIIDELMDLAARRALVLVGTNTPAVVREAATAAEASTTLVQQIVHAGTGTATGHRPLGDFAEAALTPPGHDEVFETGWGRMDMLGAVPRRGEVMAIAARPGHGKTAVALALARRYVKLGIRVGFQSLEMGGKSLFQRLLAAEAGVPLQAVRTGEILDNDQVVEVAAAIAEWPLDIIVGRTVNALHRYTLRTPDCQIVFVDYLQLMDPPTAAQRFGSRVQEVTAISACMRELAQTDTVAIVVLVQLNRDVEKRGDAAPRLSDLRESGAMEQDADIVWGLYRPALGPVAVKAEAAEDTELNCRILKHRNGPTGKVKMHFQTVTQGIWQSAIQDDDEAPAEPEDGAL